MAADEPPYLSVGTDVSAKYRGAFCEAKVKKVARIVKCKVSLKEAGVTFVTSDEDIKGPLKVGLPTEVRNPDTGHYEEAMLLKVTDSSTYTVVFDDGDERTLRRSQLCLKGNRHFLESETLDQLPLTNPEHFGTPVMQGGKKVLKRQLAKPSGEETDSDESYIESPPVPRHYKGRMADLVGRVVCMEIGDKKKLWVPSLVVTATASDVELKTKDHFLVKSFKDGKVFATTKRDTKDFQREMAIKNEEKSIKVAMDKALVYFDTHELPANWDRTELLGSSSDEEDESDSSDDEPSEEKDRFVAQLFKFMDDRGTPINKVPTVCNRDLNMYRLFRLVQNIGGYNKVTNQMKWRLVHSKMSLPPSSAAANQMKSAYKKYLHAFEDFYRKLGSSMGTISRPSRSRHNSGRSIISFREREKDTSKSPKSPRENKKGRSEEKEIEPEILPADVISKLEEPVKTDESMNITERITTRGPEKNIHSPPVSEKNTKVENKIAKLSSKDAESSAKPADKQNEMPETMSMPQKNIPKPNIGKKNANLKSNASKITDKPQIRKVTKLSVDKIDSKKGKVVGKADDVSSKVLSKTTDDVDTSKTATKAPVKMDENVTKKEPGSAKTVVKSEDKKMGKVTGKVVNDEDDASEQYVDARSVTRSKSEPKVPQDESKTRLQVSKQKKKPPVSDTNDEETKPIKRVRKRSMRGDDLSDVEELKKDISSKKLKTDKFDGTESEDSGVSECGGLQVGSKLKVKYGRGKNQKIYEAKVVDSNQEHSSFHYLVHYAGWNTRYDEWVKKDRIVECLKSDVKKTKVKPVEPPVPHQVEPPVSKQKVASTVLSCPPKPTPDAKLKSPSSSSLTKPRPTRSNSLEAPLIVGLPPKRRLRCSSGLADSSDQPFDSEMEETEADGQEDSEPPRLEREVIKESPIHDTHNTVAPDICIENMSVPATVPKKQAAPLVVPKKVATGAVASVEQKTVSDNKDSMEKNLNTEDASIVEKTKMTAETFVVDSIAETVKQELPKGTEDTKPVVTAEETKDEKKKEPKNKQQKKKDSADSKKKAVAVEVAPEKKEQIKEDVTEESMKEDNVEKELANLVLVALTEMDNAKENVSENAQVASPMKKEKDAEGERKKVKKKTKKKKEKVPESSYDKLCSEKTGLKDEYEFNDSLSESSEKELRPLKVERERLKELRKRESEHIGSIFEYAACLVKKDETTSSTLAASSSSLIPCTSSTLFDNTPPDTPEHSPESAPPDSLSPLSDDSSGHEQYSNGDTEGSQDTDKAPAGMESPSTCDASVTSNSSGGSSGNIPGSESSGDVSLKRKVDSVSNSAPSGNKKRRRSRKTTVSSNSGGEKVSKPFTSKPTGMSDSDECSQGSSTPQHGSMSPSKSHQPKPSKFNFNVEEGKFLEGEKRIQFLMEKINEIRKIYTTLKTEVASIDRRRKRARRKEKEAQDTVRQLEVECS